MSQREEISLLRNALKLSKEMMIANDLILPKTFEVIDEALFYPYPEHNTNGDKCWCDPEIEIMENGNKVLIHKQEN